MEELLGGAGVGVRGQHGDHISPREGLQKPTDKVRIQLLDPNPMRRDRWKG
jgi:hypothetical protein